MRHLLLLASVPLLAVLAASEPVPVQGTMLPAGSVVKRSVLAGTPGLSWLRLGPSESPTAASGHRAEVQVLTPATTADGECLLRLTQWQGQAQAGGERIFTGNALLGPAGANCWLRLAGFSVTNGAADRRGGWTWGPQRARDIFLRFGFVGAPAADLPWTEGAAIEFGQKLAAPAVVVQLSLRHGIGGSDDFTVGYGFGCAVVQIPAGLDIHEARKDAANVLCEPQVLKKHAPADGGPAFRFQMLTGGHWLLQIDLDRDGETDLDLHDGAPGCRPATVAIREQSGLVINTIAAGGNPEGTVGLSEVTLGLRPGPDRAPGLPAERWPLRIDAPARWSADPCVVAGWRFAGDLALRATQAGGEVPVHPLGQRRFAVLARATAPGETALPLELRQQGRPETVKALTPVLTPLDPADDATWPPALVMGQRLLLTGGPWDLHLTGPGTPTRQQVEASKPLVLSATGTAELCAGGKTVRRFTVGHTDLPAVVAAQEGKPRVLDLWCRPGLDPATLTAETAEGPATVTVLDRQAPFLRLLLRSPEGRSLLRLRDAGGAVLAQAEVVGFSLKLGGGGGVIDADAGGLHPVPFGVLMKPWAPGVKILFRTIDCHCSFRGGALTMTVDSSGGPASNGEAPMERIEDGGTTIGRFRYAIMLPGQDSSWAHNFGPVFPEEVPSDKGKKPSAPPAKPAPPVPAKTTPPAVPPPPPPTVPSPPPASPPSPPAGANDF